jgi:hypothetical protein
MPIIPDEPGQASEGFLFCKKAVELDPNARFLGCLRFSGPSGASKRKMKPTEARFRIEAGQLEAVS